MLFRQKRSENYVILVFFKSKEIFFLKFKWEKMELKIYQLNEMVGRWKGKSAILKRTVCEQKLTLKKETPTPAAATWAVGLAGGVSRPPACHSEPSFEGAAESFILH